MRHLPPEPNAGDKITADIIREIIRAIKERTVIKGPNYSTADSPNGLVLKFDIPKATGSGMADHGCWRIAWGKRGENDGVEDDGEDESGETSPVRLFKNQYYSDGEVVHHLNLTDAVEDFVCQGEPEEGEEYTEADKPYVALVVPATAGDNYGGNNQAEPALEGYATLADMVDAQKDPSTVVFPLYKFSHGGAVIVDFRDCPELQVAENLP